MIYKKNIFRNWFWNDVKYFDIGDLFFNMFYKVEMMFEWNKFYLFGFDKNIFLCYNYRVCLKLWRWVRRRIFIVWLNKFGKGELEFICIIYMLLVLMVK